MFTDWLPDSKSPTQRTWLTGFWYTEQFQPALSAVAVLRWIVPDEKFATTTTFLATELASVESFLAVKTQLPSVLGEALPVPIVTWRSTIDFTWFETWAVLLTSL